MTNQLHDHEQPKSLKIHKTFHWQRVTEQLIGWNVLNREKKLPKFNHFIKMNFAEYLVTWAHFIGDDYRIHRNLFEYIWRGFSISR